MWVLYYMGDDLINILIIWNCLMTMEYDMSMDCQYLLDHPVWNYQLRSASAERFHPKLQRPQDFSSIFRFLLPAEDPHCWKQKKKSYNYIVNSSVPYWHDHDEGLVSFLRLFPDETQKIYPIDDWFLHLLFQQWKSVFFGRWERKFYI